MMSTFLSRSVSDIARLQATKVFPAFLSGPVTRTTRGGLPGFESRSEPRRNLNRSATMETSSFDREAILRCARARAVRVVLSLFVLLAASLALHLFRRQALQAHAAPHGVGAALEPRNHSHVGKRHVAPQVFDGVDVGLPVVEEEREAEGEPQAHDGSEEETPPQARAVRAAGHQGRFHHAHVHRRLLAELRGETGLRLLAQELLEHRALVVDLDFDLVVVGGELGELLRLALLGARLIGPGASRAAAPPDSPAPPRPPPSSPPRAARRASFSSTSCRDSRALLSSGQSSLNRDERTATSRSSAVRSWRRASTVVWV